MRRSLGFVLALPVIAVLATPAGAGVSAAHRPPTGPATVTTDNETSVLYDDDAGGNASATTPPSGSTRPTARARS